MRKKSVRNPLIIINGVKRFICKRHGLISKKDTQIAYAYYDKSKEYGNCLICKRDGLSKIRASLRGEKKEEYDKKNALNAMRYYKVNKEKVMEKNKKRRDELNDTYVKTLYVGKSGMSFKEIPSSMIDTCRAVYSLKRKIKEKTK